MADRTRRRRRRRWIGAAVALLLSAAVAVAATEAVAEIREREDQPAAAPATPPPPATPVAPVVSPAPTPVPTATHAKQRTPRPVDIYRFTRPADMSPKVRGIPERVYVPDNTTDTVTVIDPKTFRIVRVFKVGAYLQHITPAWNLQHLYVENSASDSLTVIDPRRSQPVRTIPGMPAPYNLYFAPDGTKAVLVAEYDNLVEFRDPHTWKVLGSGHVPWRGGDHGDFTANGRFLLMSTEFAGHVVKIDTETMRLVGSVDVGGKPIDIKSSPDGTVFYVANQSLNGVTMLDPMNLHVMGFIPTGTG